MKFEWSGSDDVTATSDLTYAYILEGKEDSWSNWTYDTSKSYSGLGEGEYTFKVKARDENGNVDPESAKLSFTVSAPES